MSKITVSNLSFCYIPEEYILKNINLKFDSESTAIIGQNGAGKTTFVKLLKGLLTTENGEILIDGMDSKNKTVAELSKHIGMVFQNPNDQIFKSKIIDEVMFGPLNIFQDKAKAYEQSIKSLEMVGLSANLEDNPYDLGLSERKLITIASVMAMDADIIILDEPTIAQDSQGKKRIGNIINSLKSEGKLVITITHDMDFVANYFDRVIIFNKGEVYLEGATKDVFSDYEKVNNAYLELPNVTQLGKMLNDETYIDVNEFIEAYRTKN